MRDGHQSYSMGVLIKKDYHPQYKEFRLGTKNDLFVITLGGKQEVTLRKNPDPSYGNTKPSY